MIRHILCSVLLLVIGVWWVDAAVVRTSPKNSNGRAQIGYGIKPFGQLDKKKLYSD